MRESAENCAGAAVNPESALGCICGLPVKPRGTLNSAVPVVERTTSSPSPTTGPSVYAVHLPSGESEGPVSARHLSYWSCVMGFFVDWAGTTAATSNRRTSARHGAERRCLFIGRASWSYVGGRSEKSHRSALH